MPQLTITTADGKALTLTPIVMSIPFPSQNAALWLRFQGRHVEVLSEKELSRVQQFMVDTRTEAMTDGSRTLTLAGNGLALCRPEACAHPVNVQ